MQIFHSRLVVNLAVVTFPRQYKGLLKPSPIKPFYASRLSSRVSPPVVSSLVSCYTARFWPSLVHHPVRRPLHVVAALDFGAIRTRCLFLFYDMDFAYIYSAQGVIDTSRHCTTLFFCSLVGFALPAVYALFPSPEFRGRSGETSLRVSPFSPHFFTLRSFAQKNG